MTNTYFASATWYDDDDSEVCYQKRYQPTKGNRIPYNDVTYYGQEVSSSYNLKDEKLIEELKERNKRIIEENKKADRVRQYKLKCEIDKLQYLKNLMLLRKKNDELKILQKIKADKVIEKLDENIKALQLEF